VSQVSSLTLHGIIRSIDRIETKVTVLTTTLEKLDGESREKWYLPLLIRIEHLQQALELLPQRRLLVRKKVLTFHNEACIELLPPLHRLPPARKQGSSRLIPQSILVRGFDNTL